MKRIKRINELFDDEDLKNRFEIPHLKGEMDADEIINWEPIVTGDDDENSLSFLKKILFRYPILNSFNKNANRIGDTKVFFLCGSSYKPAKDDNLYYSQLGISFFRNEYYIYIILRKLDDVNKPSAWLKYEYNLKDIDDVYDLVGGFMSSCVKLDIIKSSDKNTLRSN